MNNMIKSALLALILAISGTAHGQSACAAGCQLQSSEHPADSAILTAYSALPAAAGQQ
jgi:hypothetical protein